MMLDTLPQTPAVADLGRSEPGAEIAEVTSGGPSITFVRGEILTSWRESAAAGLRPDALAPPSEEID